MILKIFLILILIFLIQKMPNDMELGKVENIVIENRLSFIQYFINQKPLILRKAVFCG